MINEGQQFKIRIPEDLKIWVKEQADINRRSMTAQILFILENAMKEEKEKGEATA